MGVFNGKAVTYLIDILEDFSKATVVILDLVVFLNPVPSALTGGTGCGPCRAPEDHRPAPSPCRTWGCAPSWDCWPECVPPPHPASSLLHPTQRPFSCHPWPVGGVGTLGFRALGPCCLRNAESGRGSRLQPCARVTGAPRGQAAASTHVPVRPGALRPFPRVGVTKPQGRVPRRKSCLARGPGVRRLVRD